MELAMCS